MNKKLLFVMLTGILTLSLMCGCRQRTRDASAKTPDTTQANAKQETMPFLIIGEEFIPYEYVEDGQAKGIDVEIVGRIMEKLGVQYEIRILPWARCWKMCENGNADAVLSTSYKSKREPFLYYTDGQKAFAETKEMPPDYLWVTEYVFFMRKMHANSVKFDSWEQLKSNGYRVGMIRENSYFDDFWEADLDTYPAASARDCFLELMAGKTDIYPQDKTVGLATLKELGLSDKVTYLPKVLYAKPYPMPFIKKSSRPDLLEIMEKFYAELRNMRTSGEYQEIYDKYTTTETTIKAQHKALNY